MVVPRGYGWLMACTLALLLRLHAEAEPNKTPSGGITAKVIPRASNDDNLSPRIFKLSHGSVKKVTSTSVTTVTSSTTVFFPSCTVNVVTATSIFFCAAITGRARKLSAPDVLGDYFQEDLSASVLSLDASQGRPSPKLLKIFYQETWSSVLTVSLTNLVVSTTTSPTIITTITSTITEDNPVFLPSDSTAPLGLPECK